MVRRQGHHVLGIAVLQCASEMVCRDEVKEFRGNFQRRLALQVTELVRLHTHSPACLFFGRQIRAKQWRVAASLTLPINTKAKSSGEPTSFRSASVLRLARASISVRRR